MLKDNTQHCANILHVRLSESYGQTFKVLWQWERRKDEENLASVLTVAGTACW